MNNLFRDAVIELDIDRTLCVDYVTSTKKRPSILNIKELGYEKLNFPFSI